MFEKDLKFNISEINNMKNKLETTAVELEDLKKDVVNKLDILKKDWKTPAGKKFMKDVNLDWTPQVDKYVKIINAVKQLLDEAVKEYQTVIDEINRLKFD